MKSIRLTFIWFHILYWVAAYILLCAMVMLLLKSQNLNLGISIPANILSATVMGVFQGIAFTVVERSCDNEFLRRQSLAVNIIVRVSLYFLTTIAVLGLFRYLLLSHIRYIIIDPAPVTENEDSWRYIFALILLYNFVMSMIVSFIELASKQFSAGVIMPLLSGKYQVPQEEYRVFLFMDLQSSTTIAEQLGHFQYSALIRECFLDINSIAARHKGQIYQYVGDEVVLTWDGNDASKHVDCIHFFFDCIARFNEKSTHYQGRYGVQPVFKAGAHVGVVTAVEVGEIKRDIAYHGDTLNTAARLQSICNEYGQILMISASLASHVKDLLFSVNFLGSIRLKGKNTSLDIFGIAPSIEHTTL